MKGLAALWAKLKESKGYQGEGGGSGDKVGVTSMGGPDSDYGRSLRGEMSPGYNDAMAGRTGSDRAGHNLLSRFDPSNKDEVLMMQNKLNKMGYLDSEGNQLAMDGQFGNKTLSALRSYQGKDFERVESKAESLYGSENASIDYQPGKAPAGPMGAPSKQEMSQEPTMQRNRANLGDTGFSGSQGESDRYDELFGQNAGGNSKSWMQKLFK